MTQSALISSGAPEPSCVLSPCGRYRYCLRIPLDDAATRGACLFLMANPSTAVVEGGRFKSDPTVSRCIDYATRWGFRELVVANVRAWRETDPKKLPADPVAIGEDNDAWLRRLAYEAELVVCGWGKLGGSRGREVLRLVRFIGKAPHALKLNDDGSPAHPLYLAKALVPVEMGPPLGHVGAEPARAGREGAK